MSERNYQVQTRIQSPVKRVFDAIASDDMICNYFTDRTSGPLTEGEEVVWEWNNWGKYPVQVIQIVDQQLIALEFDSRAWGKTPDKAYPITVRIEFESLDPESTMVRISEQGWLADSSGLRGSHDNCSGWTHMSMCLKAYLEHGLDLR